MKAAVVMIFLSILAVAAANMECFSYQGAASEHQQEQKQTLQLCDSSMPFCFTTLLKYQGLLKFKTIRKGCSAGGDHFCNQTTWAVKDHINTTHITRCCDTDLCNEALFSAEEFDGPGELDCYFCNGDPNLCGGDHLPAVRCNSGESECAQISISGSLKGVRMQRMIKGCARGGSCTGLVAFSNGEQPITFSADAKCCNGSECNSGTFSENDLGKETENGLECYSCTETGKGECSTKNKKPMKCLGPMNQCADVRGRTTDQILMSGCATETFCRGLYPDFKMGGRKRTTCCAGSLCNQAEGSGIKGTK